MWSMFLLLRWRAFIFSSPSDISVIDWTPSCHFKPIWSSTGAQRKICGKFSKLLLSYKKLTVILAVKHLKGQNAPENESMWLWIDFISSKVIRQLCARNRLKFKSLLVHIFYISLVTGHIQTSLVLAEIQ